MNRKYIFHIIGLVLSLIAVIKGVPLAVKIILSIFPLAFFLGMCVTSYLKRVGKKDFINEYFAAIVGTLLILLAGKVGLAALTITLFSASITLFKDAYHKAQNDVDELCRILPQKAKIVTPEGLKNIPCADVRKGDVMLVKEGEIIPCDGYVLNGAAIVDYTNVFGSGNPKEINMGENCYSGGIVQGGNLTVKAACDITASLSYVMDARTKQARRSSDFNDKLLKILKIFQPAYIGLGFLLFLIFIIATGDYRYSMNILSVMVISSATLSIVKVLPFLYHSTLLEARRKGAIFTSTKAIEELGKVQSATPPVTATASDIQKIEETGIIAAKNAQHPQDAKLYTDKPTLAADQTPAYKIALGFYTSKAGLCVLDSKISKVASAIRASRRFRNIFYENLACFIIAKLLIVALLFLIKLSPAAAVLIEFASWLICLVNATKRS